MPGIPHEVVLLAIRENPELFAEVLRRVAGAEMPGPIEVIDSNVRFAASLETRPDLVIRTPSATSRWTIIELQNRRDDSKCRSWPLAASVLLQRDGMGDVVVITASRSVAAWARRAAHHSGERGTSLGLTPVILFLSKDQVEALLDPARPELAIFAVWARCRGHGLEARRVATRALELTARLPAPLQDAQSRAILAMLSQRLMASFKEMTMDADKVPETKASRAFRLWFEQRGEARGEARGKAEGEARGKVEGKREALLAVLAARGFSPTREERTSIAALSDPAVLDHCIQAAVTTASVGAVLAIHGTPRRHRRAAPARARKPRAVKHPSRRR
jgi:hypothetical protein